MPNEIGPCQPKALLLIDKLEGGISGGENGVVCVSDEDVGVKPEVDLNEKAAVLRKFKDIMTSKRLAQYFVKSFILNSH